MVLKQIQDLLHDHDCVIIPDFGGLIAQYASAKIHPVKHTFTPPSKKIAFNEKLKHNDGLLISNLAQHLKVPSEQAQQMVAQFVGNMQTSLTQNKRFELQGIGVFRYNAEHKIEFEYLEADNFLGDSFGLPELEARPIIPSEAATLRTIREKAAATKKVPAGAGKLSRFSRKYATVAGTVLVGGLTVAMVYLVSIQPEHTLSSLNPVTLFSNATERTVAAEETVPFMAEKAEEPVMDELPVTPEATSVEAVEADYAQTQATAGDEAVSMAKLPAREVKLPEGEVAPVNAMEMAPKTSAVITESKDAAVTPVAVKNGTKLALKPEAKTVTQTAPKAETAKPALVAVAKTAVSTDKKSAEKAPVKNVAAAPVSQTINATTGRYFVISGGYLSLENAERSKKDLTNKGADSDVILPAKGSKLHRVSVAEFETMEMAAAKLPELRKKFGNSLWILNY